MHIKHKSAFFSGLSLFLCFCLLYAAGSVQRFFFGEPLLGMILSVMLAFFLPAAALLAALRKYGENVRPRIGFPRFRFKKLLLAIYSGVAIAVLAIGFNLFFYHASGFTGLDLSVSIVSADSIHRSFGMVMMGVVLAPALFEEFFLRGVIQPLAEKTGGTAFAIVFAAALFALLHGSMENFVGPLAAGCLYGYLAYVCDSVWPAVLAHAVSNFFYVSATWLTDTYAAFGIWEYFPFILVICFLLFAYLAFRAAEDLLEDDEIPHFVKREVPIGKLLTETLVNPGYLLFMLAFAAKAIFGVI